MSDGVLSRRNFMSVAGVAAAGVLVNEARADETAQNDSPRLPMKLLLRGGVKGDFVQQIKALSPDITIERDIPLTDADALFGNISEHELSTAKNLRWVQCQSAGVEHYPLDAMADRDIILTNAQGCYGPQIAEHVFGLLFAMTRGIGALSRKRAWQVDRDPIELRGMTMGIIGLGGIGREVARRAKAMDMKVLAVDAEPIFVEKFAMVDEVRLVDDGLMDLLKASNVVVSAAPHTRKSRGMLGVEQFAAMKEGSYFINVSRGKLVQTDALLEALKSNHLAGAGLDVTDPEPLPADHPLWRQDNAVLTPHIAGRSQLGDHRMQTVFAQNVARYVAKLPMLNIVDKRKGY